MHMISQKQQITSKYNQDANKNISQIEGDINSIEDIVDRLTDQMDRAEIRSPVNGIVFQVHKTTKGSVLGPGEPFIEIFPEGESLKIKALVAPKDISEVSLGQKVDIVFSSDFRQQVVPTKGVVDYISTDTLVDQKTGAINYVVEIALDNVPTDRKILPGNTAQVFFKTPPKTLLEILAGPISNFAFRSFKG